MSISEIQKKKFLDNIYKLYYSIGISETDKVVRKPDELEIKKLFDNYFSKNRIGVPLAIDVTALRNSPVLDPDILNEFMARILLNIEVLYDSADENTKKLLNAVSLLNKKFSQLKDRRATLEAKVDDLLFSNSNTDGYFYSFSDSFSNLKNVDLSLTTAYVDVENRKVTLPSLKSSVFEFNAPGRINFSNVTYTTYFNGGIVAENVEMPDINNLFDGLGNTSSTVEYASPVAGACAIVLNIPLNTPFVVSRLDGRIATGSAVSVVSEIIDSEDRNKTQFKRKQSNSDYDRFSFEFDPQSSGLIRLTLIKYEPDMIDLNEPVNRYKYIFTFRDLIVSGKYYDSRATLVSSPLSIPAGDSNKAIDLVSIEAVNENEEVGNIQFFVAKDINGANSLSDFNWIPISPSGTNAAGFDQVVSFSKATKEFVTIKTNANNDQISLLPLSTDANASIKNPTTSIYNGVSTYRIGSVNNLGDLYNSYILDAINNVSFKYVSYIPNLYLDKNRWSSILNRTQNEVQIFEPGNIQITNSPSIPIALNISGVSGYMQTSLLAETPTTVSNFVTKSGNAVYWNMAIYLNGTLIADIQDGVSSKEVSWNFIEGVNNIVITFDAEGNSSGSISLMSGVSISNYGSVFLNYYSYVDPFDFRINRTSEDKVFTIDKYLGNREILCRSYIKDNSRLVYQKNNDSKVEAIRFRADLSRMLSPFGTPVLEKYRIKFKNSI